MFKKPAFWIVLIVVAFLVAPVDMAGLTKSFVHAIGQLISQLNLH